MTDPREEYYRCIGYCMTDPDTGCCIACGRPPAPVENAAGKASGAAGSFADQLAIAGAAATDSERFPVDPLP